MGSSKAYRFQPTFGPPERYWQGYQQDDLVAGLQELFAPGSPLLTRTLDALGLDPAEPVRPGLLEFLNYGQLQIVFRLTLRLGDQEQDFVAAVSQRPELVGSVLREAHLLQRLSHLVPALMVPGLAAGTGETPSGLPLAASTQVHIPMARCISRQRGQTRWGIYNPEPTYRFEEFPGDARTREGLPMDEACRRLIIASLVATYDDERGAGVGGARPSGGDFLLTRDYRYEDPDALRRCWRMIAARAWVRESREDYLDRLRWEFTLPARLESPEVLNGQLLVNHKSTEAFGDETIEAGIALGRRLWNNRDR